MFYLHDDFKKLEDLKKQAYLIHKDYIERKGKSLDDVIRTSKAYADHLSLLKIKHLKTGDTMSNKTKNKVTKQTNVPNYPTPIEKFSYRNKIEGKPVNNEIRNLRLFTVGVILVFIGAATVIHKYGNNETHKWGYHYPKH